VLRPRQATTWRRINGQESPRRPTSTGSCRTGATPSLVKPGPSRKPPPPYTSSRPARSSRRWAAGRGWPPRRCSGGKRRAEPGIGSRKPPPPYTRWASQKCLTPTRVRHPSCSLEPLSRWVGERRRRSEEGVEELGVGEDEGSEERLEREFSVCGRTGATPSLVKPGPSRKPPPPYTRWASQKCLTPTRERRAEPGIGSCQTRGAEVVGHLVPVVVVVLLAVLRPRQGLVYAY
jgi:hypothetical protein